MRRESDTLRPCDRAPSFTLHDARATAHTLEAFLEKATLLLVFDRGTW